MKSSVEKKSLSNGSSPIVFVVPPLYGLSFAVRRVGYHAYRCCDPSVKSLFPMELWSSPRSASVLDGSRLSYLNFFQAVHALPAESVLEFVDTGCLPGLQETMRALVTKAAAPRSMSGAKGVEVWRGDVGKALDMTPYQINNGHRGYLQEPQVWMAYAGPERLNRSYNAVQRAGEVVWIWYEGEWDETTLRLIGAWAKSRRVLWGMMGGRYPRTVGQGWVEAAMQAPDQGLVAARVEGGDWMAAAHLCAAGIRVAYPYVQAGIVSEGLREFGVVDSHEGQRPAPADVERWTAPAQAGRAYFVPIRHAKLLTGQPDPVEEQALALAAADPECCGVYGENLGYFPRVQEAIYGYVPTPRWARRGWVNHPAPWVPRVPVAFDPVEVPV